MWPIWLLFKAKDEMTARRAAMRRLIRWRKRVWRHLSAVPIGTLVGGAASLLCHYWGSHFPSFCAWFSRAG